MAYVEKSIEVNAPVQAVYNQWTQFEAFPEFMDGVEQVEQLDEKHLLWRVKVGPQVEEYQAEIVEQVPDKKISWQSIAGAKNGGTVSFRPEDGHTRLTLRLEYQPEGVLENVGERLGMMVQQVETDLANFKQFIEQRGEPTGAWRGEIHGRRVEPPGDDRSD